MSEPVWADFTDNMLVSSSIFTQLPDWAKSSYQNFADFLEAYFEWMEETNGTIFHAKKIRDYRDIDKTIIDFISHFESQYLKNIPTKLYDDTGNSGIKVNKATLLKNAKKFYSAKGSEKSYKLLFRILFNEDVQLYYPKIDMLYASDGKWTYDKIIRISITDNNDIFDFVGRKITGSISGATAAVENAVIINISGTYIGELYLNNIIGTFVYGETISTGTIKEKIYNLLTSIKVINPGNGYQVGDKVTIGQTIFGYEAEVEEIKGPINTNITILDPGFGYEDIPKVNIIGTGFGAKAHATLISTGISRIEVLNGGRNFNDSIPPTVVFPSTVDTPTAYATVINGQITEVTMITNGNGYTQIPTITFDDSANGNLGTDAHVKAYLVPTELKSIIVDNIGRDYTSEGGIEVSLSGGLADLTTARQAIISATINGGIQKIKITNPGFNTTNPTLAVSFTNATGIGATAIASTGAVFNSPGYWINTDGFLSSDKYLQDSYYYQVFSYVLKSTKSLLEYQDIVKKILHPAGLKLFGTVLIENTVEIGPSNRTFERNKFWYPPYLGHRERPNYDLVYPTPNTGYWNNPNGLANTQMGIWLDTVIGEIIDNPLTRTNLEPDPYIKVFNPDYQIPEALVEYDMIEGVNPQILYDLTINPTYNGIFGNSSVVDSYDPTFVSTGVQFLGTYVDCSTVPIDSIEQSVVVVFKMNEIPADSSIIGCIDINKDTITTGYSIEISKTGILSARAQMRLTTNVTHNLKASYPIGTITVGNWNMATLRYKQGEVTVNYNKTAPIIQNLGFDPQTIGVNNNSTGWFIGNQGYIPPTAGPSIYGQILYGTNNYFGVGSYNSVTTFTDSFWDQSLFWNKPFDGSSSTEVTIVEPLPGLPFLNGIIAYVLIYNRLLTDDEVTAIYNNLKIQLQSRGVDLP